MNTPSAAVRNGIIATVTIVAGALIAGALVKSVSPDKTHSVVGWFDGGPPADVRCVEVSGVAQVPMLNLFGLAHDGGPQYAHCAVCGSPKEIDGGQLPNLPNGMYGLVDTEFEVPWDAGRPQMECWVGATAPFPCACAKTFDCYVTLPDGGSQTAPSRTTLKPETGWFGDGCVRKACVELSIGGLPGSSWPSECGPP